MAFRKKLLARADNHKLGYRNRTIDAPKFRRFFVWNESSLYCSPKLANFTEFFLDSTVE